MSLTGPDLHRLRAAVGWLELGNAQEAIVELEAIHEINRGHEEVLETRWLVLAELKRWIEAAGVAGALKVAVPHRASGWLHYAYALRRAPGGGLNRALEALLPAADKFPDEPTIPYNLACYCCQLRRDAAEVLGWLEKAMNLAGTRAILEMASKDSDLAPMMEDIQRLARSRTER